MPTRCIRASYTLAGFALSLLIPPPFALSQEVTPDSAQGAASGVYLDLPLADLPYNTAHGLRAPSMQQSLAVSTGFYEAAHSAIHKAWGRHQLAARLSIVLFDYLTFIEIPPPGGDAWLHEEYHRAVLGNRGIDSFNDVYNLKIGPDVIAVSHVEDADLVRLKRDHPAEQVRLGVAGIEGEYQLVQALERNQFFGRSTIYNHGLYWLAKLGSAGYVASGVWDEVNEDTDEMNAEDGADVERRDFTGHDFTAWVYDLHRPDEPYAARGVHPSGVGIDRYIKPSDLTDEELDYLETQGWLQFLNFVDPFLLRINGITVGNPFGAGALRLNGRLGHVLTSFGSTVDVDLFIDGTLDVMVTLHRYANRARSFPGVDGRVLDYPIELAGHQLALTPRVALWLQPEDQRFRTGDAAPGGLVSLGARHRLGNRWGAFAEIEGKSAGWVAGNVHLAPAIGLRAGASILLR